MIEPALREPLGTRLSDGNPGCISRHRTRTDPAGGRSRAGQVRTDVVSNRLLCRTPGEINSRNRPYREPAKESGGDTSADGCDLRAGDRPFSAQVIMGNSGGRHFLHMTSSTAQLLFSNQRHQLGASLFCEPFISQGSGQEDQR
ncbi:hypothetical protein Bbelb_093530 [Branchiostoma belcheri]|nr:hypothetical protein Bbelb_093530 [Branchiostoma belcheri]